VVGSQIGGATDAADNGRSSPSPVTHETSARGSIGVPPFVFEDKGKLVGFSIDLWRSITDEIGVRELFVNRRWRIYSLLLSLSRRTWGFQLSL